MMQIDVQATFLMGSTIAFIARRRLPHASPEWLARTRTAALIFGGVVFSPVWLYITLRWTPWETMYIWDLSTVPLLVISAFIPALSLSALAGFWITQRLITSRRMPIALLLNGAVVASCVVIVALAWDRFTFVGTLAEFQAGGRGNLLWSDLARAFIVANILIFGPAAILMVRWLKSVKVPDSAREQTPDGGSMAR